MWDVLLRGVDVATMKAGSAPYGMIRNAAIGIKDGRIAWIGPGNECPQDKTAVVDSGGGLVTPGLIDCHSHLVFGGNRAGEWARRLGGATYEEIARQGGGILSTVEATRAAPEVDLVAMALPRVRSMIAQGVTTVEIKSGYGLDLASEVKMLEAATLLASACAIRVSPTLLGAHALPADYQNDRARYIEQVCEKMIPAAASNKIAVAVDAFCEGIAFTPDEVRLVFEAARAHGLRVKLHAEQLSDSGGATLAAEFGALSADHLEHLSDEGVAAMAKAGTVAVLLPGAFYFMRETKKPPVEALRGAGVPIAIATDCNPGTSPIVSPLIVLNMACTLFGLTPEEALAGMTRNAAMALGLDHDIGTIEVGKRADLAVWNVQDAAELSYWIGADLLADRYFDGKSMRELERTT